MSENETSHDLSHDDLPATYNVDANSSMLVWESRYTRFIMFLKVASLLMALGLAGWFLCKGLVYTEAAIYSVIDTPSTLAENKVNPQKHNIKEEATQQDEVELTSTKDWNNALISSGSIITLIALILAVGLTLLLAVIKISIAASRSSDKQQGYVGITSPFSDLLMQLTEYLKNKEK